MDLAEAHAAALDHTGRLVAGVRGDQWGDPTVCDEWNVRELVNHIVTGNWWAEELAGGKTIDDVGDRLDGDVLGDDPASAYRASAEAAAAAFSAPGALDAPCAVSYGPVPGSVYCGHRLVDVLIHGWDLAQATGQDTTLPAELVEQCQAVVAPQADVLTASGAFGTRVDVTDHDPQRDLLALLGRES